MIRVAVLLAAVVLAGCRVPTEPTPNAVREAMRPDTLRMVTEVDGRSSYSDPVGGKCGPKKQITMVRGAWVLGATVVSDTVLVPKCLEAI